MPRALERLDRRRLDDTGTAEAWDAYCRSHAAATPYHLSAWSRAVAGTLAHEPCGLIAVEAGKITGVLPLFLRRSRLFGTNLVSIPAANVGGPLANDDATACALVEAAIATAVERKVDFLEIRDVRPESAMAGMLRLDVGRYSTAVIDLEPGEAAVWSRVRKELRRRVRRAQGANELVFELCDDMDAFYEVYTVSVKRLGSPPFSRAFFNALQAGFGPELKIGVAWLAGDPAAVDLLITLRDVRYSVFAGSRALYWERYANQFLLWAELQEACAAGMRRFDLGRSLARSGSLDFKLSWGGIVEPLTYGYHLERARKIPVRNPDAPFFRAAGRIWSYLPDGVVNTLGPQVVKHLF